MGPTLPASACEYMRPVSCHQVDYDHKSNGPVAVCFAGKDDLQALMASAGWAWAYTAFSDQYVDAERRAAARGVGVHGHRCQPPWEWRAQQRAEKKRVNRLRCADQSDKINGKVRATRELFGAD
jgi:endonuclease YncB( thermonuclease family)